MRFFSRTENLAQQNVPFKKGFYSITMVTVVLLHAVHTFFSQLIVLAVYLQIFHANTDPSEVVLNRVPQPVLARFVRIRPQTWKNGIALRFELYGCQITGVYVCDCVRGLIFPLFLSDTIS